MNKPQLLKCKTAASLACLALLSFAGSASAQLTVTTANQQGSANTWPFTPSWTVNTNNSLIAGLAPSTALGNFSLELAGRSVNSLTLNTNLTISIIQPSTSTDTNYVTCGNGSGAGSLIVYTLPASADGYNLTNITVYGGWANNGRDQQGFTVLYSTVDNPTSFKFLTTVNYNPSVPGNTASANREIINDALGGLIAVNVVALEFDFSNPQVENGYTGYSAITVGGTPASSVVVPVVSITTTNETGASPFTPTWTAESPSLIAGMAPTTASGNFTLEGSGGTPALTDSTIGISGSVSYFATCGAGGGSGSTLIYTLTNSVNGSDVTNIVVYSGWGDRGRDGQYFKLSYSTVSAPTTYIPITTVYYNPRIPASIASANRVAIAMNNGTPLGTAVANLKFDFSTPPSASSFDNGYQGYSEIIVQGTDTAVPPPPPSPYLTQDTLPTYAETVVGDQVILTAAYSNAPPANVQWQFLSGGTTNNIAGATSATLTLNNVQLTNSGSYRLEAVNATNGAAAPSYSTWAALVVSNSPAPVNGIIVNYAGQCGLGALGVETNFVPTWTVNTANDLILGAQIGSGATYSTPGAGNFGSWSANSDPTILSDGSFGVFNYWPNVGGSQTECTCGISPAGQSMTYTFDTSITGSTNGYDITNIVVYGGWGDGGRNEQKYQVLYTTVGSTNQTLLVLVDYNPNDPNNTQSATRTTLIPTGTALAQHVSSIEFNFNLQGAPPKNGSEGYSEFVVAGTPSGASATPTQGITPLTAEDVQGSSVTFVAGFSGADSVQWQKNGTNIPGANSMTLTLTNLQFSDTATNGGYSLTASNRAGVVSSGACPLIVDPAPAAVGNIVRAFAYQTGAGNFSPTWDTSSLTNSLIYQQNPPSGGYDTGNFNDPDVNHPNTAGGLPVLTDGSYGFFATDGSHPAFATCGNTSSSAGKYVIYTLGANANGYDVTNVQIASGWNDNGRNSQFYTVAYSTVANPTTFFPITVVTNRPLFNNESVIRATITPATGLLASNVYAIFVDFTTPTGVPNGYSGYSEISVFGSPSVANNLPTGGITAENQSLSAGTPPSWTIETDSLIAGQAPTAVGPGNFQNEAGVAGTSALTDGTFGNADAPSSYATCGTNAGQSVTYTSANGWNLTNLVVYSGWGNYNRDGQFYHITYSTLSAPTTFIPLASVFCNPPDLGGASANRVNIAPLNGATYLATNVYAVTFDFTPQTASLDYGYSGYAEIVLQGSNLAPATPPTVATPRLSGGNLIVTGTGGTPNRAYSWLSATNLLTPLSNWTVIATGVLDSTGAFSNSIPINPSQPADFLRLRMP